MSKLKADVAVQQMVLPLTESLIASLRNKSCVITAEVVAPAREAEGVIVAIGGATGGASLYCKGGNLKYCYNFFGLNRYYTESEGRLSSGKHLVRMEFAYDGGGMAEGGDVTLYVDGERAGQGRVERTEPLFFADPTCDVGTDTGSPVTDDYGQREFNGQVNWVEFDLGRNAQLARHYLTPVERLRIAG